MFSLIYCKVQVTERLKKAQPRGASFCRTGAAFATVAASPFDCGNVASTATFSDLSAGVETDSSSGGCSFATERFEETFLNDVVT